MRHSRRSQWVGRCRLWVRRPESLGTGASPAWAASATDQAFRQANARSQPEAGAV